MNIFRTEILINNKDTFRIVFVVGGRNYIMIITDSIGSKSIYNYYSSFDEASKDNSLNHYIRIKIYTFKPDFNNTPLV